MMEHARKIRDLALHFRIRALTVKDPFLCRELHELANICEAKAGRIDRYLEVPNSHSARSDISDLQESAEGL
jgi:hypothetical protein